MDTERDAVRRIRTISLKQIPLYYHRSVSRLLEVWNNMDWHIPSDTSHVQTQSGRAKVQGKPFPSAKLNLNLKPYKGIKITTRTVFMRPVKTGQFLSLYYIFNCFKNDQQSRENLLFTLKKSKMIAVVTFKSLKFVLISVFGFLKNNPTFFTQFLLYHFKIQICQEFGIIASIVFGFRLQFSFCRCFILI